MAKEENDLGVKALRVIMIKTTDLKPNPHNPRLLFDRAPMETLKESIKKVGILVPLTVYKEKRTGKYVILDGQRRWTCAVDLKLKEVPVNEVAEPTLVQNIVTMFQIHKLREDWELMPTALKVELLMKELDESNASKLAKITGLDEAVIVRCKKLLSYDRKYQDMMLDPDPAKRIKADFFIELYQIIHDREVMKFTWFKQAKFINQMLAKYLEEPRTIKAVTDFRIMKQYVSQAKNAGAPVLKKFAVRLKEFAEDHGKQMSHLELSEVSKHAGAKAIIKKIDTIYDVIHEIDADMYYGEEALWKSMAKLIKVLELKLKEADKRK